ncbi:Spy/CpxP family protein refolding chaperone [Sulfurimonas sp.]|uniref:Spy/CpxP family protein refolding chaperone n=1 Tax=Sulfurimonas sp. TaxID=2022749 RepID=UPI002AB253B8|nr:Spy/CpxP family protein refolding chaperone [Sulfurimonas sp.]
MNKTIIIGLGTSVLLASSLLAFSPQSNMKQGNGYTCKQHKMMKQGMRHNRGHGLVKMFMKLDLSDKQRTQIRSIIKDNMKSMPNPKTAFSDTSFNKEKFIKLANQKRNNKVERRADTIEKVYNVLNSSQKKDFKTMLDMRDIMKKNYIMQKSRN